MATDAIVAIQDMGAAGLTSSSFEMASKGGSGVELELDQVPCREDGMTPYEMMLSQSQERMMMMLQPAKAGLARGPSDKCDRDFAILARLTAASSAAPKMHGEDIGTLPIHTL